MTSAFIVYTTVPNRAQAKRMAAILVREKLAACVSMVPGVRSTYRWKGKVETASEVLIMMKTLKSRYPSLARRIGQLHSYAVPEIVAVPVARGGKSYLQWLADSLHR